MPIEIDLGERFGKIKIEREKSVSRILTDLSKGGEAWFDMAMVRWALGDFVNISGLIKRAHGGLPERIRIASYEDDLGFASLQGYKKIVHELSLGEDGKFYEETTRRPRIKSRNLGSVKLDDQVAWVDPKHLPDWVSKNISPKELQATVNRFFYPKTI